MPIDTEQWRASIGLFYASHVPLPPTKCNRPKTDEFRLTFDILMAIALLPLRAAAGAFGALQTFELLSSLITCTPRLLSSLARSTYQKLRGGIPILLALCLVVRMLLIVAGDVETNPGPPKMEATHRSLSLPVLLKFPMAQGKCINIPEQISDKYMTFGILLLNDDNGAIVNEISLRYLKDHVQINIDILRRWINGEGRLPVSWETLTACLRDTGLSKLADDIQQNIETFEDIGYPKSPEGGEQIALCDIEFGKQIEESNVLMGKWISKDIVVAVKTVIGRFMEREVQMHSQLDHPNVIKLHGIVKGKPHSFLVLEFAERGSLYDVIHKQNCHPSLARSLKWAKEIAEGMNYLHKQDIIHRDLKSANVLLTADQTAKLCDFGSAVKFDYTKSRTMTGTFRWMAPEVLLKQPVSLSCDVFSYGMVLYEILTHYLPFAGITEVRVAGMIVDGEDRPKFCDILSILKAYPEWPSGPVECASSHQHFESLLIHRIASSLGVNDLSCVREELLDVSHKWFDIGLKLQLSAGILECIRDQYPDQSTSLREMLLHWLKKVDPPPTWEGLACALESRTVREPLLGEQLRTKYCKTPQADGETVEVQQIEFSDIEFLNHLGDIVYKGKWISRNIDVAIKRVVGGTRKPEVEIHSQLKHPNIIRLHGVLNGKLDSFLVLEFAERGSMHDLIHRQHYHPDLTESLKWASEIAEGMNYLHHQKIMHRDLKSANVLLSVNQTVKLCDFGSATKFDRTRSRTLTGTFRWMAPEVLNKEAVSLLGMVLLEILTYRLPFAEITELQVAGKIMNGETPAIPVTCELYLAHLLRACWKTNPKDRPSFSEVLSILHEHKVV